MKSELNVWYMDDGTLGGDADVLLVDFNTVRRVGQELGLELNEQKCELITDNDDVVDKFRVDAPSILHIKTSQAVLLGAPIGSTEEIDSTLSRKVAEFQRLTSRLKQLNAHDAFFLLKIVLVYRSCSMYYVALLASTVKFCIAMTT